MYHGGEENKKQTQSIYYADTVPNAEGLNQLWIIYILEIKVCGIWSMWKDFMSWGTTSQKGEMSFSICWILLFKSMCYCKLCALARTMISGKLVPLKMILSSGFNVLFFQTQKCVFIFKDCFHGLSTVHFRNQEESFPKLNEDILVLPRVSVTQAHFPARMTVLICLLLSSLSVFTMSQIDSKGRRVYPFVFFPHKMHFKCFVLLQMLCNHSFKDMQPTIFSPDNCADMKIEGASLLF